MKTLEFIYQETQIHFLLNPLNENVMINATEMAKLFNKRTGHYLANESTKEFILELERAEMSVSSDFKIIENRGHMGIWFCEDLAIDFAMWLDVGFRVWVCRTIREMLRNQTKRVKKAVDTVSETELALQRLINEVDNSNNVEAKNIIKAFQAYNEAKKEKSKALISLTKQLKMEL